MIAQGARRRPRCEVFPAPAKASSQLWALSSLYLPLCPWGLDSDHFVHVCIFIMLYAIQIDIIKDISHLSIAPHLNDKTIRGFFMQTKADLVKENENLRAQIDILLNARENISLGHFDAWQVLEQTDLGVFVTADDGKIRLANAAAQRMSGFSLDQLKA